VEVVPQMNLRLRVLAALIQGQIRIIQALDLAMRTPANDDADGDQSMTTPDDTDSTTETVGANASKMGVVSMINQEIVSITASFMQLDAATTLPASSNTNLQPTDTCNVSSTTPEIPVTEGTAPVSISAGEVLTVSSPAGTYAELKKQEFGDLIVYGLDEVAPLLSAPPPNDLTISIPGDAYPAFTNVAIPNIEPLQVNSPAASDPITASTTFSWTASSNPESRVQIVATEQSADTTQLTSVFCTVIDDGSFEFPAETKAEMGDAFSGTGSMSRGALNIQQTEDAVLFVSTSSQRVN